MCCEAGAGFPLSPHPSTSVVASSSMQYDDVFMTEAFSEAQKALSQGEVAVGCVFVENGAIVARGHNLTNARGNAVEHAGVVAMESLAASQPLRRCPLLQGLTLYVTVEPCIMCASALLYAGVSKVYYGCGNPRFGGNGTVLAIHQEKDSVGIGYDSEGGHRADEAVALLTQFYSQTNTLAPDHKRRVKDP